MKKYITLGSNCLMGRLVNNYLKSNLDFYNSTQFFNWGGFLKEDNKNLDKDSIFPILQTMKLFINNDYKFLDNIRNIDVIKRYSYYEYSMYHIKNMIPNYVYCIHHFNRHIIDMPKYIKDISRYKDNPADVYIIQTEYNINSYTHESIILLRELLQTINKNAILYIFYSGDYVSFVDKDISYFKIYDRMNYKDWDKQITLETKKVLDSVFDINYTISIKQ